MKSSNTISKKAGLPPGSLVHIGRRLTDKIKVSVIDYDASTLSETVCKSIEECFPFKETDSVSWINVDGLHDTETIASIGNHFELHPLLLEEVVNTQHRPKVEEFDNYLFLTLKMLSISKVGKSVVSEQISFVLGKGWVISFQEKEGKVFNPLLQRLREIKGNIRKKGADYLLSRLIDTVVDDYFFVSKQTTAVNKFVCAEPLLSDLGELNLTGIDWVVVGGESGKYFRPCKEEWVIHLRDQCEAQGVLFTFKQWGGRFRKHNGSLLQGQYYHGMPVANQVRIYNFE